MALDYEFIPSALTIGIGDSVTWTSVVGIHTSAFLPIKAEWWDSGPLILGKSFVFTFPIPGIYNYTGLIDRDMYGTITVVQPTPEFSATAVFAVVACGAILGFILERKLRARPGPS